MHTQWDPKTSGKQYQIFLDTVNAGLAEIRAQGHTPIVRGMIWQQGESDAKSKETAGAYGQNLAEFIAAVREAFEVPEMLFAFGNVLPAADYRDQNSPPAILRRQQQAVSENSCNILSTRGALLVNTSGLSLRKDDAESPYPDDVVHFGTEGTLQLGQRFADAMADAIERDQDLTPETIALGPKAYVTVYLPDPDSANGKAVVICPGGGYGGICTHTEGTPIARHLLQRGIAAVVLKYRLPQGQHDVPGSDARAAIELTRRHAQDWRLDPSKIGIWGFSAGGHLAATVGTLARGDQRADFQILFYPVISMQDGVTHQGSRRNLLGGQPERELIDRYSLELQVSRETSPAFILHAASDTVVDPLNSLRYYEALVREKVPAVMHFYQHGGHGPGAFQKNPSWQAALDDWLSER